MRAHQLDAPGRLVPTDVAAPDPQTLVDGEVMLSVEAVSICGSDLPHYARGGPVSGPPRAGYPVHEVVGRVVAARSPGLGAGDRVVGWASNDDGLAELVVTDGRGLARCDDSPLEPWQVIVAQPLACVLYAVDRLPDVTGQHVAVIGLGPIGLLFCHLLRQRGAASVTGVDPVDRSDVAERLGVTDLVQATSTDWVAAGPRSVAPSVVVEAVGHQGDTLRDAISVVDLGGTIYCFGIPQLEDYRIDLTAVVRRNLTLVGGLTWQRRTYLTEALRHLDEHPELIEALVTDILPTSAAQEAFQLACRPRPGRLKVVLTTSDGALPPGQLPR